MNKKLIYTILCITFLFASSATYAKCNFAYGGNDTGSGYVYAYASCLQERVIKPKNICQVAKGEDRKRIMVYSNVIYDASAKGTGIENRV